MNAPINAGVEATVDDLLRSLEPYRVTIQWPDDVRASRRTPVRSIDGSVSRPPRPGVKFRGRRELPSPGLRRDRSGSCMAAVHAAT